MYFPTIARLWEMSPSLYVLSFNLNSFFIIAYVPTANNSLPTSAKYWALSTGDSSVCFVQIWTICYRNTNMCILFWENKSSLVKRIDHELRNFFCCKGSMQQHKSVFPSLILACFSCKINPFGDVFMIFLWSGNINYELRTSVGTTHSCKNHS